MADRKDNEKSKNLVHKYIMLVINIVINQRFNNKLELDDLE